MGRLTLKNVTKRFGDVAAATNVTVEIPDGEFAVIVGPSGCGKTTLLRMVAGLERPTVGTIALDGRVLNALPPRERNVAMVFQDYALYPHMTVFGNMAFGLEARKMPKAEICDRVERVGAMLGIGALLRRRPGELSGGQRQRVAMGRAIVREPALFLFDEPLSNLDAKLRVQMRGEIRRLCKDLGTTALYVTHDQVEAMTMADRIVVMNEGRVRQVGTPEEVYNRPADRFVAGFIGSPPMNFLEGSIARTGGRWTFAGEKATVPIPAQLGEANGEGPACFGIRPEAFQAVSGAAASEAPELLEIPGKVSLSELIGRERLLTVETAFGAMKVVVSPEEETAGETRLRAAVETVHMFRE